MRIACFNDHRVGVLVDGGIHDVTDLVDGDDEMAGLATELRVAELISRFDELRAPIVERVALSTPIALSEVRLRCPTPRPRNFWAAPRNYATHGAEMVGTLSAGQGTPRELGLFVKGGGSLADPDGPIELPPLPGRRFDHEAEIGVVIGRTARGVSASEAMGHVFGYTLVIDATMRLTETQREERTMRKSFATFSPVGPAILTADEVADPGLLTVRLWVNDELRQEGSLSDLIVDVAGLVEMASAVSPLEPGDLIATGTPAGVGPIAPGDEIVIECEPIGRLRIPVTERSW